MFSLEELFCSADDFCNRFEPRWKRQLLSSGLPAPQSTVLPQFQDLLPRESPDRMGKRISRTRQLSTLHRMGARNVSAHVCLLAMPSAQQSCTCFGKCSGISFMDSTALSVCHNRRIKRNKVFENIAERGKTSVDWFFGFKLHLVVNDRGEWLNILLTPGNTDDRKPVPQLLQQVFDKVFADKGYVSQKLATQLLHTAGIQLITKLKRNMKQRLMPLNDRLPLRKRSIIETIIDQLKNISQIEHSRHRSAVNCFVNILGGLIAYCHQPKKPSIALDHNLLLPA